MDRRDASIGWPWSHRVFRAEAALSRYSNRRSQRCSACLSAGCDEALIARRIARHEHFMPSSLLHSQFEALEERGPDESPVVVSIEPTPREIVSRVVSALARGKAAPPAQPATS
jgi:gluconokinase